MRTEDRPGRHRDRPVALGQRIGTGHPRRRGGPAARAARRPGGAAPRPRCAPAFIPVDWNEINGDRAARGRRGHARRGPAADRGRARAGACASSAPAPAVPRPATAGVRAGRHPPGGPRAAAGHLRGAHPDHRRLAALPRGVPAGRGPGAGRGAVHRRGAAGRRRRCRCPGFTPDGLAVFGVDGRPADGHRPPRPPAPATSGRSSTCRWRRTTRPPRWSAPAGPIYLPTPEDYRRRYPADLAAGRAASAATSWAFLPLIVRRAGRSAPGWRRSPHPVAFTPDERSVLTTVARMLAQALARAGVQPRRERELARGSSAR